MIRRSNTQYNIEMMSQKRDRTVSGLGAGLRVGATASGKSRSYNISPEVGGQQTAFMRAQSKQAMQVSLRAAVSQPQAQPAHRAIGGGADKAGKAQGLRPRSDAGRKKLKSLFTDEDEDDVAGSSQDPTFAMTSDEDDDNDAALDGDSEPDEPEEDAKPRRVVRSKPAARRQAASAPDPKVGGSMYRLCRAGRGAGNACMRACVRACVHVLATRSTYMRVRGRRAARHSRGHACFACMLEAAGRQGGATQRPVL